jgi:hypothetical protein
MVYCKGKRVDESQVSSEIQYVHIHLFTALYFYLVFPSFPINIKAFNGRNLI